MAEMEDPALQIGMDDGDDDDDDMANLFSFGSSDDAAEDAGGGTDAAGASGSGSAATGTNAASSSLTTANNIKKGDDNRNNTDSPDSFLELLTAETSDGVVLLDPSTSGTSSGGAKPHDQETQELLDWLDHEEGEEQIVFDMEALAKLPEPAASPEPEPAPAAPEQPTIVTLPPTFESFQEALTSNESTAEQIRELFVKERTSENGLELTETQRAELYCRMVCHKSLDATVGSSLADSFEQWKKTQTVLEQDDFYSSMIRQQELGQRIAKQTGRSLTDCEADLIDLVHYHLHQTKAVAPSSNAEEAEAPPEEERDALLPAVAAVILSAGIPVSGAAVMLSKVIPNFMPLLALPPETEQREASLLLHTEFYLLACYHVPLLVFHLDRYLPGWYCPKLPEDKENTDDSAVSIGRNLKKKGQVPPSWLLSLLSGECGGTILPAETILMLWDGILTDHNNASRFFLTLAVLEKQASTLLLLTGPELLTALQNVWTLDVIDKNKEIHENDWIHEWWPHARALQDSTPDSAMDRLKRVEDEAVQQALVRRQERKEAALQARLEAEAAAHLEAQERKADEARQRLSRARLVAFYRKHAPDKESNIDKIMETFAGRLDVLDHKLKTKYGEGFNPAIKPKPPKPPNKLLATVNQGIARVRSGKDEDDEADALDRKPDKVSVMVTAAEVLPVVCWSKEAQAARGHDKARRKRDKNAKHLKFYLVDSRSEEAAQEQGRFPTAVSLSPEAMMDPERLKQNEEKFEALRGAVHIVIMGEGFNALPNLYNQKLSPKLEELMQQDESRTNLCALFFHKLGLPFVSVLDGGFAAAHSWLVREGPAHHLDAKAVLVDYNPDNSLFGQLETLHNASATEKAQRKMANLLESSMVTMTKRAQQLERLTAGMDAGETKQGPAFKNPFARMAKRDESDGSAAAPLENNSLELTAEGLQPPSSNPESDAPVAAAPAATDAATKPVEEKANPFKGLGAAFNEKIKQAQSNAAANPKRNPWARFGGGGAAAPAPSAAAEGAPSNQGLRGFDTFRWNAMSRLRKQNSKDEDISGSGAGDKGSSNKSEDASNTSGDL